MKKVTLLLTAFYLFISCSSDSNEPIDPVNQLTSCFELDKTMVFAGETIKATNCSQNATTYFYEFGNGENSIEASPEFRFNQPGEYTVKLTARDNTASPKVSEQKVTVISVDDNFMDVQNRAGENSVPIYGELLNDNKIIFLEDYDDFNNSSIRINYVEFDIETKEITRKILFNSNILNSGRAFIKEFSNGNRNIIFSSTLDNFMTNRNIIVDANINVSAGTTNSARSYFGFIDDATTTLYYGISSDNHPLIEKRDQGGNITEEKKYDTLENSFVGGLVKTSTGFMGYGGKYTLNTSSTSSSEFQNYEPLLFLFDNDLNLISANSYTSNLKNVVINFNDLNGNFSIKELSNGNYVTYSHNEIRILDNSGTELNSFEVEPKERGIGRHGLTIIPNGFVISTLGFLEKYSNDGVLLTKLKTRARYAPSLFVKDNKIYFVSQYTKREQVGNIGELGVSKTFIGAVDFNLQPVSLTN